MTGSGTEQAAGVEVVGNGIGHGNGTLRLGLMKWLDKKQLESERLIVP
jgi:hypothetical protein